MTGLDLTPAPAAAPPVRRVLRHAALEARLLVRNPEQLLLALVIPVGMLVVGRLTGWAPVAALAPSVLGVAVWSSAFTSVAIATAFERRYGVLERLAATPLGRSGLVAGKIGALLVVLAGQLVALSVVALAVGWRPAWTVGSAASALLGSGLAIAAFVGLALLLAGRLRAESVLGLANLVYLLLLVGGGLLIPLAAYPDAARPVVAGTPTGALGEGLRTWSAGGMLWWPLAVLAVWSVVAAGAARKGFRWTS